MKTALDRLLASISPERSIEETYNRTNEAIVTFDFDQATVDDWNEFKCCMARFLKHLDKKVLRLTKPVDIPLTEYWRHCIRPLLKIYGGSGDVTAFTISNTGNEGGLYAVLKAFAIYKAEEYTKNEISAKVSTWWHRLSADQKLQAAREYVAKYGNIIPSELSENGAALVLGSFWKVLEKHPFIVKELRQTSR
ncbi:MAG: hypothetical protein ACYSWQ_00260 [Planctomycetota bacterium]|jgi:hypothetical protein